MTVATNPFFCYGFLSNTDCHCHFATTTRTVRSTSSPQTVILLDATTTIIDGLAENFNTLCQIDDTIQALKEQLPLTVTKPLTSISASKVYSNDVHLTVVIAATDNDNNDDDITLIQSKDELVSLSDVLVVATSAARQANSILSGNSNNKVEERPNQVQCQLIIDDSFRAIRVPWKTTIPILGRVGVNANTNRIEGISELVLDEATGKIRIHRVLNVEFNGRNVNGPAIGQTLRAIQSASSNVQQSPLLQSLFASTTSGGSQQPSNNLFNGLRDGILEQVATSLSSSMPLSKEPPVAPTVYCVPSVTSIQGWIYDNSTNSSSLVSEPIRRLIPFPGSHDWEEYALAHNCLERFYDDVLPRLSKDGTTVDPDDFASDAKIYATDGSVLLEGRNAVADFYQSTAFARTNTGGSWSLKRCSLIDWRKRTVTVEYKATNNIPPATIKGRDTYKLSVTESRPIVEQINQESLSIISSDSSLSLDSQWVMKNLVTAVEGGRLATGSSARDVFSDLLFQQLKRVGQASSSVSASSKKSKLPQSAAATAYYIMSDLHERSMNLLNDTTNRFPPAAEYMTDDVELRGYLGETLLRGANVYNRAVNSFLSTVQQSITQKRLVVEKTASPGVELLANGDIRFYQIFFFRLPPPGASMFLPESSPFTTGVPIKVELVSDYKINAETGRIYQHSFVETRINGQLTPGDVFSRTVLGFLNPQDRASNKQSKNGDGGGEDMLKTFSDTLRWFQKISESSR